MITGTQHRYWYQYQYQYHHHSPKSQEPLPLTYTQYSRTQSQNPRTKEPRLKGQEQWAMSRNQNRRARPIEPRFKIPKPYPPNKGSRTKYYERIQYTESRLQETMVRGQRTNDVNHLAIPHNGPAWKMSQYDWVRLKDNKEPFMSNTTWSND